MRLKPLDGARAVKQNMTIFMDTYTIFGTQRGALNNRTARVGIFALKHDEAASADTQVSAIAGRPRRTVICALAVIGN